MLVLSIIVIFLFWQTNYTEGEPITKEATPTTEYLMQLSPPITPQNYPILANGIAEFSKKQPDFDVLEVISYVDSLFGKDSLKMQNIISCESGWNPNAYNPEIRAKELGITKYSSCGLTQENDAKCDDRSSEIYNWKINIDMAFEKYQTRGFYPWLNCAKVLRIL